MKEKTYEELKEFYEKVKHRERSANKRYRERHPDKMLEAQLRWQAKNVDKLKEYRKFYYIRKKIDADWWRVRDLLSAEIKKGGGNPCQK